MAREHAMMEAILFGTAARPQQGVDKCTSLVARYVPSYGRIIFCVHNSVHAAKVEVSIFLLAIVRAQFFGAFGCGTLNIGLGAGERS